MKIKAKLSERGMVLYVLSMAAGEALSIKDIIEKVQERFNITITRKTVVRAIDEADYVTGKITEVSERRGALRLHTKVFAIEFNNVEI